LANIDEKGESGGEVMNHVKPARTQLFNSVIGKFVYNGKATRIVVENSSLLECGEIVQDSVFIFDQRSRCWSANCT
jgi:hypothetical protein